MAHYIVFGDSITYGEGDLHGGWVQYLREELINDIVYNLGIDGETTTGLVNRLEKEIKPRVSEDDSNKVDPVPWAQEMSYKTDLVKQYSETMKAVAVQEKVKFVDSFNLLPPNYLKTLNDGVHPNHAGHQMIFKIVNQYL